MITRCFCSAETSGIDESVLDFLAAEYWSIWLYTVIVFVKSLGYTRLFSHLDMCVALCLKAALPMKRLLIAQKSTRCCSLLFRTPRGKLPMQFVTLFDLFGMMFDLFSYFGVPAPSQKYKWLGFNLIENSTDIAIKTLECRNIISGKLASWCVQVDDADNLFRVWNEFAFDGNFWNRKALAWFPISLNFQTYNVLEFWRCFFDFVRALFGIGNLICRTLTLSDIFQ